MDIKVTREEILNGDISKVKTVMDSIALDSSLVKENEGGIVIKFDKMRFFDLITSLQDQTYKAWFKKIDSEYPYIPFFLDTASKTLLLFILGNTEFTIDEQNNLHFDDTSKQLYISDKKSSIKVFSLSHNIDPKPALHKLVSFEPGQQKTASQRVVKMEDYLNKFGAIVTLDEQRELVVWLLIKGVTSAIKILLCSYIKNCAQPFFSIIIEHCDTCIEYSARIIASEQDVADFCRKKSSIKIMFVFKEGETHQSVSLEQPFTCIGSEELEKKRTEIKEYTEHTEAGSDHAEPLPEGSDITEESGSIADDETLVPEMQPQKEEPVEKREENRKEEDEFEEAVPQNETTEQKIARLENTIVLLKEKIRQKDNLIEDLESAINERQRSKILTFLKGLFK